MRYLSAHYIFPVSSAPLKRGILCVDDQGEIIDVIDTGGRVTEREKLEFYDGILVPGFVNAHCHLELSHLRGAIPPHSGLPSFLSSITAMRPADGAVIIDAARKAEQEMLRAGIVAVGDISNRPISLEIKKNSRLYYHTFIEVFGLDTDRAGEIFDRALELERLWIEAGMPVSIVPHALYSVSTPLFEMLGQHYQQHPPVVSIHHQESNEETTLYPRGEGLLADVFRTKGLMSTSYRASATIIADMERCLSKAQQCLLVHNTFSSATDMEQRMSAIKNLYWVLCPASNLYIQNRLADVNTFINNDLNICLGTDSLASNTHLSILEEMKVVGEYFPNIPLTGLLSWATLNGARALKLDQLLGSFEKGKRPGINLVSNIDYNDMRLTKQSTVTVLEKVS